MKSLKPDNKGKTTLFANPALEFLTKSSPLASWCMFTVVIASLLYFAVARLHYKPAMAALLFFSGLAFWTLFEYLVHRFVFHLVSSNPRVEKITYLFHGNHHHFPKDRSRLFMPPVPSLIIASSLFFCMHVCIGEYAFMFFPGFILGHLMHASLHYAIHAWGPPFKWLKPLWRNHYLHHYTDEEKGFGVTSTIWDRVFHTMFDLKEHKIDKARVRELMFDDAKKSM